MAVPNTPEFYREQHEIRTNAGLLALRIIVWLIRLLITKGVLVATDAPLPIRTKFLRLETLITSHPEIDNEVL